MGSGEQRITLPITPGVRPQVDELTANPPELLCGCVDVLLAALGSAVGQAVEHVQNI